MKTWRLAFLILGAGLYGCNDVVKMKDAPHEIKKTKDSIIDTETNSEAIILNNIVVHESGGIIVSRAYLAYKDGLLVSKDNRVALNDPVYFKLIIKKGLKADGGKVSVEASQKIETADGQVVVDEPALFKTTPALTIKEANALQLKATITKTRPGINYFIVSYRVWDKSGDGEVKGHYRLFIADDKE